MRKLSKNYHVEGLGMSILLSVILLVMGCATAPEKNPALDRARAAYEQAAANPEVKKNAPVTMYEAEQALKIAEQAKNVEEMNYLSLRAERMSQIAIAEADKKIAEKEREELSKQKDKLVLQARELETKRAISLAEAKTSEAELAKKATEEKMREVERAKGEAQALAQQADKARKEAEARALEVQRAKGEAEARTVEAERSQKEAEAKTLELEKAKKEAEAKTLELEKAKKEAEAKRLETELARAKEEEVIAQKKQLESELSELKAKQTEKGIVLTLGDILFETGKANLMPGAVRSMDVLADFMKKYPKRNVLIEGFTDSVGTETYNLGLSQQRADAVRDSLRSRGIGAERITTKGYGEQFPIASNKTPAGRQQNRRVEITILDEGVSAEKMKR
jgi:outer membrane protein OmpA-like peptidoglycan-associated protein